LIENAKTAIKNDRMVQFDLEHSVVAPKIVAQSRGLIHAMKK